ncbi:ras protein [Mycena olivaceomarginata]|nr:ras protein [Mycena olivaceomarginata]
MDQWTVVVLGDAKVGKTALVIQFTLNCFVDQPQTYDPSGSEGYRRSFVVDNDMCFVEVVDCSRSRRTWMNGCDAFPREGEGFILMYSMASRSTFDRLEVFHQAVRRAKKIHPILMLVGNKADMADEREVSKEEGAALARQLGCEFVETSAKTAQNVEQVFTSLNRNLHLTMGRAKERKKKCIIL